MYIYQCIIPPELVVVGALVDVKVVVGSIVVVGASFVTGVLSELDSDNSFGTSNFGLVAINTIKFCDHNVFAIYVLLHT